MKLLIEIIHKDININQTFFISILSFSVREIKWEGKAFTISNDDIKIQLVQMEDNIQLAKVLF